MNDPIKIFTEWFTRAHSELGELGATTMTLATATKGSIPSARIVLLKAHDERGFVFYTNLQSRKSEELKTNPYAALCFHWSALEQQIRIEGKVEQVSDKEADEYFASRPLVSRIGACASDQSRPLDSRETLMHKVEALKEQYSETNPPTRPKHWSGWRVVPQKIEFWHEGKFRLHDRELYTRKGAEWSVERLYP